MIPFEDYYDLTTPTEVAVSPDGDRIAVVAEERSETAAETRSVVFVAPADGSNAPHRLTRASQASAPTWSPDGTKLAVLAARDRDLERSAGSASDGANDVDTAGDDDEAEAGNGSDSTSDTDESDDSEQVWVFDLERGGDPRQLTAREEGVRSMDWSPGGDRIVFASRDPTEDDEAYLDRRREDDGPIETERLQHVSEGAGYLDAVRTYLFVADVEGGPVRRLDEAYGRGAREPIIGLQPAWGDGGIAFTSYRGATPDDTLEQDVYLVDPETGTTTKLTDGGITAVDPTWGPDGERIAFVAGDAENFYAPREAYVLDTETGTRHCPSGQLEYTLSRYGSAAWLDEDTLVASLADRGTTRLVSLPLDGGKPRRLPPDREALCSVVGHDVDGGTVATIRSDPADGIQCYAGDTGAFTGIDQNDRPHGDGSGDSADLGRPISAFNDELIEDWPTVATDRLHAESGEGAVDRTVDTLVTTPATERVEGSDGDGPFPTVVRLHGGPMSYDHPEFDFTTAAFASRGYAVLQPNFRGSISYGQEYAESLRGQWGTHDITDVLAAVDAAIDAGVADPDRLFVTGFSYGGILTAHLLTETDRFVAGAAEHGIYDVRAAFGADDSHCWLENEFGRPWEAPDRFDAASSLPDVDDIETPLLVTAGDTDYRCPPDQADRLFVSLKKRGVPSRLVRYDEGHEVTAPDRAIHRLEELCRWFERFDPAVAAPTIEPRYCEGGVE